MLSKTNKLHQAISEARQGGLTLAEMNAKFGISLSQLSRILKANGVTKPDMSHPASKQEWIRPRLEAGMSIRDMAVEADVRVRTMKYWVDLLLGRKKVRDKKPNDSSVDRATWDSRDWFEAKYTVEKLGMSAIAHLIGRSVGFVNGKLAEFGIKKRSFKDAMSLLRKPLPTQEWLQKHYVDLGWSIVKCAKTFKTHFDNIIERLREFGIKARDASEQHRGELNEFHGKEHPPEIIEKCKAAGTAASLEYWSTGDIAEKKRKCKEVATKIWADPVKRAEVSRRTTELCKRGKCNSRQIEYLAKDGRSLMMKSSWEVVIASFLDSCGTIIKRWDYETVSIPYADEQGVAHNYLVDFEIEWASGLKSLVEVKSDYYLSRYLKEQIKAGLLAIGHEGFVSSFLLHGTNKRDFLREFSKPYISPVAKRGTQLFSVSRAYLEQNELYQEVMFHEIIAMVCPWAYPVYGQDELIADLDRIRQEKLESYAGGDGLRASAPNGGGMPGRKVLTHFQPHFWDVTIHRKLPLREAFSKPEIIHRCLSISRSEKESLSFERLLREINFHYSGKYGRTSHFSPGFARVLINKAQCSGKWVFDPCCGWGGRLIGATVEGCRYSGCDLSPLTVTGLDAIAKFLGIGNEIKCVSCLEVEWPACDLILTSPPFYDIERYHGGKQPWALESREEWLEKFVRPFAAKIGSTKAILYLDAKTLADFSSVRSPDSVVPVMHRRHARRKTESEFLCCYNLKLT